MQLLPVSLKELDCVEVLTLMDNFVDVLLEDTEIVTRPPKASGEEIPTDTLLAEHGLCLLVKVQHGDDKHIILFDTGYNSMGVLHNMDRLAIDPDALEAIILSHAHMDHTGGLHPILEKVTHPIPPVSFFAYRTVLTIPVWLQPEMTTRPLSFKCITSA